MFTPAGFRIGGFLLPGRLRARVVLDGLALNGIDRSSTRERQSCSRNPTRARSSRTFAGGKAIRRRSLRRTGHEDDPPLHIALNSGLPVIDPHGGFFFVFQTGEPAFRKYDAADAWSSNGASRAARSTSSSAPADDTAAPHRRRRAAAGGADDSNRRGRRHRPFVDQLRRTLHASSTPTATRSDGASAPPGPLRRTACSSNRALSYAGRHFRRRVTPH